MCKESKNIFESTNNSLNSKFVLCIWLSKSFPNRSNVKEHNNPTIVWMSQLIDENSSSWNLEVLNENFTAYEATNIMSIPISCFRGEDKQIWFFNRQGFYNVRSSYQIAR